MTAGESLRSILGLLGMTQAELARRSGVSTKHINMIIRGTATLTPKVAVQLADAIAEFLLALELRGHLTRVRRGQSEDS